MQKLSDTILGNSLAVIGMCKNAGKTTVLNAVLRSFYADTNKHVSVTSVGRDGESCDVVTNTKKPRIYVQSGTLFATASALVATCDTTNMILDTTEISTPLGNIVIVRANSDGFIQIAGPSTLDGVQHVNELMRSYGATHTICDGAISRKTLSIPKLCSEFILCSGASYSANINETVADTAFAATIFCLPKTKKSISSQAQTRFLLFTEYGDELHCDNADEVIRTSKSTRLARIAINGAVTDSMLKPLFVPTMKNMEIISEDAGHIMISQGAYSRLIQQNVTLSTRKTSKLCAITVNPFSAYGTSFDKHEFFDKMQQAVEKLHLPVFDVIDEDIH